jgi:hypothetical protein
MKKLNILIVLALMVSLLGAAWTPTPAAAANTSKISTILTINNKTGVPVIVSLSGPKNYTIVAAAGKNVKEIANGEYKVNYKACGVVTNAKVKYTGGKATINLVACKMVVILVVNFTDSPLQVTLTGPGTYSYTLPAKTRLVIRVLRGVYRGTGAVCGKSFSREIQAILGRYSWAFYPCS